MIIVSHVVFTHWILSKIVTEVAVGRRQSAIARTQRSAIISLSCAKARFLILSDHNQRTQWRSASGVLLIWSDARRGRATAPCLELTRVRRHRRFPRMVGASEDERLTDPNRRLNSGRGRGLSRNSWRRLRLNLREATVGWNARTRGAVIRRRLIFARDSGRSCRRSWLHIWPVHRESSAIAFKAFANANAGTRRDIVQRNGDDVRMSRCGHMVARNPVVHDAMVMEFNPRRSERVIKDSRCMIARQNVPSQIVREEMA